MLDKAVFSGWPLRTYFGLLLLLFAVAAVTGLFVVRHESRTSALDSTWEDAEFVSARVAAELDEFISAAQTVVATTAANPAIAALAEAPESCSLSFSQVGALTGSLNILTPDGRVVCSSSDSGPSTFAGSDWLPMALTGLVTTGATVDPASGNAVFVIAAPAGEGSAVLAAVLDLPHVAESLATSYGGPDGHEVLILDSAAGFVLSRSGTSGEWAGVPIPPDSNLDDRERQDFDGTTRLFAVNDLSAVNWQVQVGADRSLALADANAVFTRLAWIIAIGSVVALVASAGVYVVIVRPAQRLRSVIAKASAAPAAGLQIEPHGPAELRALAAEFNNATRAAKDEFARREVAESERDDALLRLTRAERLESLGQLAGGMAHDFNNMLGVMLNYSAFAREEVASAAVADPERWETTLSDLTAIEECVDRASGLTRQLLAFARCDTSKVTSVQPNTVIRGLESLLERTLGENIQLDLSLDEKVVPIAIDEHKLEQILVNLATNARDAMPAGGVLAVDSRLFDVDADYASTRTGLTPGVYARLRVSDTGMGMSRETADKAFDPLFTTKALGHGTGLGLSTVFGIVTQAGGHISIYSEPSQGTTFTILIPEAPEEQVRTGSAVPAGRPDGLRGTETILVVEDDATLLDVASRILVRNGYKALPARTAREALQIAEAHTGRIDCLVTDMVLPDMSGRELATIISESRPNSAVIYASGYAGPILAARQWLGPDEVVLEKPFRASDLLSSVRAAMQA